MYKECPNCYRNWYDCVGNCIFDDFPVPVLAEPSQSVNSAMNSRGIEGEARGSTGAGSNPTQYETSRGGETL